MFCVDFISIHVSMNCNHYLMRNNVSLSQICISSSKYRLCCSTRHCVPRQETLNCVFCFSHVQREVLFFINLRDDLKDKPQLFFCKTQNRLFTSNRHVTLETYLIQMFYPLIDLDLFFHLVVLILYVCLNA